MSPDLRIWQFRQILGHLAKHHGPDLLAKRGADRAERLRRCRDDDAAVFAGSPAAGRGLPRAPARTAPSPGGEGRRAQWRGAPRWRIRAPGWASPRSARCIGLYILRLFGIWHLGQRLPPAFRKKKASPGPIGNQDIGSNGFHLWSPFFVPEVHRRGEGTKRAAEKASSRHREEGLARRGDPDNC